MKRILITGGVGFIGSNLVKYLMERYPDYQITVVDALTYASNKLNLSREIWKDRRFHFHHEDICNRRKMRKIISQTDQIIHLAAETHVDNSIYNTDDFIHSDIVGTQTLLDCLREISVERFIHISTSEVYGTAMTEFINEEHPLFPRSPYASAKAGADRLVYSYFCTFDLPVVILRPFNNYGPRQHIEKVIPCFVTRAMNNQPLPLHGDGSSTRDWVYVDDTCRAIDLTLHADLEKIRGEVFNIGTGVETSIISITHAILDYLNKSRTLIKNEHNRPGQVERHRADSGKAKRVLGWEAKVSLLQGGIQKTIEWYLENKEWWQNERYKYGHPLNSSTPS